MDVAMFDRAVQTTGAVVAGMTPEQLDGATPCPEWSVRDLLNHLIGQYEAVATGAAGEVLTGEADYTAEDHVAAYYAASVRARDAVAAAGALEKKFAMPWGETPGQMVLGLAIADTAVHGCDLAKATGQDIAIDDDVAEAVYGMTTGMLQPGGKFPRGDSFADPVEVPDDAPIQHKMLAYLGRHP
jgi:uncharacterized protein (TIGR03086 family)